MSALFLLYGICLVVGFLVGGTGMGGILIPPSLVLLSGLETHAAMATTLASFVPMNVVGCYLFARMGHLEWRPAVPLTVGGALSAGPCALCNVHFNATFLSILLSLLVLFAGFCAFRPPRAVNGHAFWRSFSGLFLIGAATGIVAGLTGAGGPLLAIAWMVTAGVHPLLAVGLSMPYSLSSALSATACNMLNGNIDLPFLWRVSLIELTGFIAGATLVHRMPLLWIRRCMAATCTSLGFFLLAKSLLSYFPS